MQRKTEDIFVQVMRMKIIVEEKKVQNQKTMQCYNKQVA